MWMKRAIRLWTGTYLGVEHSSYTARATSFFSRTSQWMACFPSRRHATVSSSQPLSFTVVRNSSSLDSNGQPQPVGREETVAAAEPAPLTVEDFRILITNKETEKQIKIILEEYEMNKLTHSQIPPTLSTKDMQELLEIQSISLRRKYQNFLFQKQMRKLSTKHKQLAREAYKEGHQEAGIKPVANGHLEYGVSKNTIVRYMTSKDMKVFYNHRQANAFLYGQPIVIDLDYDQFMVRQECKSLAKQLQLVYAANKVHRHPFALYFCNCRTTDLTAQFLPLTLPHLDEPNCLIARSDKSYLDLFPKKNLVYLTPHANDVLQSFDHDAIYIIGGIVAKTCQQPVALAKAKREGLKIAKLPLDDYLMWGTGSKSLPLNQIMQIMLEVKESRDWDKAFWYAPRRKLRQPEEPDNPPLL